VRVSWAGVRGQGGGVDVDGDRDVGLYGWCRDLDGSASRRWLRSWLWPGKGREFERRLRGLRWGMCVV
jgi:hypothetical protein